MIVAGVGYRGAASLDDMRDALALTGMSPDALASVAEKARDVRMVTLADELGLPVISVAETDIAGVDTPTRSTRIDTRFGTGSLAEAVALVAAKAGSDSAKVQITVARVQTANGMATAAIAERIGT